MTWAMSRAARCWPSLCMAFALALTALPASAVTLNDLYETDQPVLSSGRDAAFVEALKTVVVRVSGHRERSEERRVGKEC